MTVKVVNNAISHVDHGCIAEAISVGVKSRDRPERDLRGARKGSADSDILRRR